jgi:hydroxymethylbilane synthase
VVRLRIVSRGSELALWQAEAIRGALRAMDPGREVEIIVVKTVGDRILDVPLARIGDKGLFTRELDRALLDGDADLAVHSLKDLPTRLPDGLKLAAITEREDPRDVLILPRGSDGSLATLPPGARVGTSSLRRRALLASQRPDVEAPDLRGNLNTRLERLDAGSYDGILLAAAGVLRLGWRDRVSAWLDPVEWLPAVGQGALGVVARADRPELLELLGGLDDAATAAATAAERALLRSLEGGCQVPIGALAAVEGDRLTLRGLVAALDGSRVLRVTETGAAADAEAIGRRAADSLVAAGAEELLAAIRANAQPIAAQP